jgi:hypothetical protein
VDVFAFEPREAPGWSFRLKISQKCTARRPECDEQARIRIARYFVFLFFSNVFKMSSALLFFFMRRRIMTACSSSASASPRLGLDLMRRPPLGGYT